MKARPLVAVRLLLRFVGHCLLSGITTARIILRFAPPHPGLARMEFVPMSTTGAAVLGALVTLTPGTTVIDIDMQRRQMLLHLLDIHNLEATIEAIRRDFEADVGTLFPREDS